jgi:hypothetical protein
MAARGEADDFRPSAYTYADGNRRHLAVDNDPVGSSRIAVGVGLDVGVAS